MGKTKPPITEEFEQNSLRIELLSEFYSLKISAPPQMHEDEHVEYFNL